MTEKTARIRWVAAGPGSLATLAGYAGSVDADLFKIFAPHAREDCWILTSGLPGFLGYRRFEARPGDDSPEPLKDEAERWLEEFTSSLGAVFPEAHDLPPVGPDGMRELTCDACGGVFGTNFSEEQIECAHCDARRCPHCGEWFGRDD